IGIEISLPKLVLNWKVAIFGTILQVLLSILFVFFVGSFFQWSFQRVLLIGFVITISSTVVVLKLLETWDELSTKVGQNVLSVLLIQDIMIIPMIILLNFLSNPADKTGNIQSSIVGITMVIIVFIISVFIRKKKFLNPLVSIFEKDHEIQVFAAIALCFGLAAISLYFHLSAALGAFLAGIIVAESRATHWIVKSLEPFKTLFVAFFFIYIGLIFNISFLVTNFLIIALITLAVFTINNLINAIIFFMLGNTKRESIYAGALLAQIGEFSFILGTVGYGIGFIQEYSYQLIVSVICMTLFLSPLWISLVKKVLKIDNNYVFKRV
ncbi:MAG: cation:proton antiporter, partial [Nanoarchaeota archaeon]